MTVTSNRYAIDTPAATHPCAVRLDDIQRRHSQGPSLSSAWHNKVFHIGDHDTNTPLADVAARVVQAAESDRT